MEMKMIWLFFPLSEEDMNTNNASAGNYKRHVEQGSGVSQDLDNEGLTVVRKNAKPRKNKQRPSPTSAEEMYTANEDLQFFEVSVLAKEPLSNQLI